MPTPSLFANTVAGTRLYLRRTDTKLKKPTTADAEYGELFINYNSESPMLCFKDSADQIVDIKPISRTGVGGQPPATGNDIGDIWWDGSHLLVWNGGVWEISGAKELSDLSDVDGAGAVQGDVLGFNGSSWEPVDGGALAPDPEISWNVVNNGVDGTLTIQPGGDTAVIDNATVTRAGLMTKGDKAKLDSYPSDPSGLTLDLQDVTDNGSTTTNGAEFGGNVDAGSGADGGGTASQSGATLNAGGVVQAARPNTVSEIWQGFTSGSGTRTSSITAGGSAAFAGNVTIGDASSNINLYNNGQLWLRHDSSDTFQADVFVADNASVLRIQKDDTPVFSVLGDGELRIGSDLSDPNVQLDSSGNAILKGNVIAGFNAESALLPQGLYVIDEGGAGTSNYKAKIDSNGWAQFTGEVETNNDKGFVLEHIGFKLKLQSQNLSANYAIRFPPAPASADKRFLAAVGTNTTGDMDLDWVAGAAGDYLPLDGGHMTGGVSSDVGTVPNGTGYELNTHNFWEVGAVTVANPITTDLKAGQSGLFLLRSAPIGWGTFYKFKAGTPPAPTSFPAVCPFYVNSSGGETYVGPAIEVQS